MREIYSRKFLFGAMMLFGLFFAANRASAQYLLVDCSGATPGAYGSISSAVWAASNGTSIYVYPGTCYEDVNISNLSNFSIGTWWPGAVALHGSFTVNGSNNIFIYGFNVTSAYGSGFNVYHSSRNIMIDSCTSSGNPGYGVNINGNSSVYIQGSGNFSGNANRGIDVSENSTLWLFGWGGPISINDNSQFGINLDQSDLFSYGNVQLENNTGAPYSGYGVQIIRGSRALFLALNGDNTVSGNQTAGIFIDSHSQAQLVGGSYLGTSFENYVQQNGPSGIVVRYGSQLTLATAGYVTGHSEVGIDVFGNSQLAMYGNNFIQNNPGQAAIRLDGNSQAQLYNAVISGNGGPGVLILGNSSAVVQTDSVTSNSGGPILCDTSAYLVTDLAPPVLGSGNACKTPSLPGIHRFHMEHPTFNPPDWRPQKAIEDRYRLNIPRMK
jgi:Right handed beta helix region